MPKYNAKSIKVMEGLEGVRRKPAMYVGQLQNEGVFHILKEIVENSVDEFLAKNNDFVGVAITNTGNGQQSFLVADNGRGIPVEKHKSTGISTLTTIMTHLHAGGKFGKKAYQYGARGTHGVGASVTNALSVEFKVWTFREGNWYFQSFSEGKPTSKVEKIKKLPKDINVFKTKKGTIIEFTPDYSIFGKKSLVTDDVLESWLYDTAYLNSGLKMKLINPEGNEKVYLNKGGPKDYLKEITSKLKVETIGKPFVFENNEITIAFQWSDLEKEGLISYVNGALTKEGGLHIQGVYDAISKAFKKFNTGKNTVSAADLRYGIVGFINYRLTEAEFDSQTKNKLVTLRAKKEVAEHLQKPLEEFLANNKTTVKEILKRAADIRTALDKARELTKAASQINKGKKKSSLITSKLVTCNSKTPANDRELYILEGDSAKGTATEARFKNYQEILPIRGKILNAARSDIVSILKSEEVQNILTSIGIDLAKLNGNKAEQKLRTGKIILLMDADVDGKHIASLACTIFQSIFPELFDMGLIYAVVAPLFFATYKDKKHYGFTLSEIKKSLPKSAPEDCITRAKGWGEIDAGTLRTLAFDPDTRKLIKLNPIKGKDKSRFQAIMGDDSSTRKKLLGIDSN